MYLLEARGGDRESSAQYIYFFALAALTRVRRTSEGPRASVTKRRYAPFPRIYTRKPKRDEEKERGRQKAARE